MSFCALLNDVLNNNILWILQPNFQPVVLSSGRVFKLSTPTSLSYNLILINDKFIHVQGRTCVSVHDSSLTMSLYHFWVRRSDFHWCQCLNMNVSILRHHFNKVCISWNSGWDFISVVVDDVTVLWVCVVRYGRKEQNQWTSDQ